LISKRSPAARGGGWPFQRDFQHAERVMAKQNRVAMRVCNPERSPVGINR
jgi:hypothetical protein